MSDESTDSDEAYMAFIESANTSSTPSSSTSNLHFPSSESSKDSQSSSGAIPKVPGEPQPSTSAAPDSPRDDRPFKCTICSFATKTEIRLEDHINVKHRSNTEATYYPCTKCNYQARSRRALRAHLRRHDIPELGCSRCTYCTNCSEDLARHEAVSHPSPTYAECDFCSFKTRFRHYLIRHLIRQHPEHLFKTRWFNCVNCENHSPAKVVYVKHVEKIHPCESGTRWFECYRCGFRSVSIDILVDHDKSTHPPINDQVVTRVRLLWVCTSCDYETDVPEQIQLHEANVVHEPPENAAAGNA